MSRHTPAHYRETIASLAPLWDSWGFERDIIVDEIFEEGLQFAQEQVPPASVKDLTYSTAYWNWWTREWAVRDWTLDDATESTLILEIDDEEMPQTVLEYFDVMTSEGMTTMPPEMLAVHYLQTHWDAIDTMKLPPIFKRATSARVSRKAQLMTS